MKSKRSSSPSRAEIDESLRQVCDIVAIGQVDVVPAGWHTAEQIARCRGRCTDTVRKKLYAAVRAGQLELRTFTIRSGQRIYPVAHYRAKK